jgi:hypothetical protein
MPEELTKFRRCPVPRPCGGQPGNASCLTALPPHAPIV